MLVIKEEFKDRLEQALNMRDMIPADLARATGISAATISQYRSGYSKPKDKRLVTIANVLNVDPAWLMGIDMPSSDNDEIDLSLLSQEQYDRLKSYYDYLIHNEEA